ncbi:MAG: hypothetical protein HKN32_01670, partial [Flavobacteriales bacterium]|nr:hypothetical protein [Flavobacteriales bacterium]
MLSVLFSTTSANAQVCDPVLDIACPPDIEVSCGEEDPVFTGVPDVFSDCIDGEIIVSFQDEVILDDNCIKIISRVWTAEGDALVTMCTQLITTIDDTPPTLIMPDNLLYTFEWGAEDVNIIDAYLAGEISGEAIEALAPSYFQVLVDQGFFWPQAFDDCDGEIDAYYEETLIGSAELDCPLVATVYWDFYATDACGNTTGPVQMVCNFYDTTPPTFVNDVEDFTVQCVEDVPPIGEYEAVDSCSPVVEVGSFGLETGNSTDSCVMVTAEGPGPDWAIWLPVLATDGFAPSAYWEFDAGQG